MSYKGDGLALTDIIGGQITTMFTTVVSGTPHVQSGRLKALAVTTRQRLAAVPNLPTIAEAAGQPGFEAVSWGGVMVPANTPRAVVAKLNVEINRILKLPEFREQLAKVGAETVGNSPRNSRPIYSPKPKNGRAWLRPLILASTRRFYSGLIPCALMTPLQRASSALI